MKKFRVTLSGSYDVIAADEEEAALIAGEYLDMNYGFDAEIEPVVEELA